MATTIHIPQPLLELVDANAKALRLSRNRFIVRALEQAIADREGWSESFISVLDTPLEARDAGAVDEMLAAVRKKRSSKGPPSL